MSTLEKDTAGFSVIEVVLSIAVLAAMSLVCLQLFLTASKVNMRSRILDASVMKSTAIVEAFKNSDKPYPASYESTFTTADGRRLQANIQIASQKSTTKGSLYGISVKVINDGEKIYELSALNYFEGVFSK
jgi:Tfp pilus assembly protein PilE